LPSGCFAVGEPGKAVVAHSAKTVANPVNIFALGMQQSGPSNPAIAFWTPGQAMNFPGQPVLDQAIMTLQELSAGNVHFLNSISSALLKWATVFQRVASDVSACSRFENGFIPYYRITI
jgi:hypothetical protein